MPSARLPAVKTLHYLDFAFQPSSMREQLDTPHTLGFIERKENVVFHAPPGMRKTHLAVSLAVALEDALQAKRLTNHLRMLVFPSVMVMDEISYLLISRTGAMLFFSR